MRIIVLRIICASLLCLMFQGVTEAATFTVNDTTDTGPGSLRDAITLAEALPPGADTINFNIPYAGVQTIFLSSQLPALTDTAGVLIDGLSQPGAGAGKQPPSTANILIEIVGVNAGPSACGLLITSPNNTIRGLAIGDFAQSGIRVQGRPYPVRYNLIYCNFIGTDASGTLQRQNGWNQPGPWSGVEIVAPSSADFVDRNTVRANLISFNYANGVYIGGYSQAYWNFVEDNYIGTDVTGMENLGNIRCGVVLDDGARLNQIRSNVIAYSGTDGIAMLGNSATLPPHYTEYNYIIDNIIGVAADKVKRAPNGMCGINVGGYSNLFFEGYARNNTIGAGNTIANSAWEGIRIIEHWSDTTNADGNRIWQNAIYDNGLLGIDLNDDGVTPNDPGDTVDTGANQELNFPLIAFAADSAGQTTILGLVDIDSDPRLSIVEVFKAQLDPSGHGEGMVFLGATTPDFGGGWTIVVSGVSAGDSVTATTTDVANNTSEFSLCHEVLDANAGIDREAEPADEVLAVIGPNPATGAVSIRYVTPTAAHVRLGVYDASGRLVRNLVDVHRPGGEHTLIWDGKDRFGNHPASGIYFVRLESAGRARATKIVLVR